MHPILQLDRAGWTYQVGAWHHILTHDSGKSVRLDVSGQRCTVSEAESRKPLLEFPWTKPFSEMARDWDALWAAMDRVAGRTAFQRVQGVYQFIEDMGILANVSVRMSVRRHATKPLWAFDDQPLDTSFPLLGDEASPFGVYEDQVVSALASVSHVALPSLFSSRSRIGVWATQGRCIWFNSLTGHERLARLAELRVSRLSSIQRAESKGR